MRRTTVLGAAIAVACLTTISPADVAFAGARPSASLHATHGAITAHTAPHFTVKLSHLPRGTTTYLQRRFGSKHVWKNVVKLKHSSGTITGKKLPRGRYAFRLHGVRGGKSVETSATRYINSYDKVPFSSLCAYVNGECSSDTAQVGDKVYTYVLGAGPASYPEFSQAFQFPKTSCRSLDLSFAYTAGDVNDQVAYLKLVQSTDDAVTASTPINVIGHLKASLDHGAFYLDASVYDGYADVLINGSASCYTASGAR